MAAIWLGASSQTWGRSGAAQALRGRGSATHRPPARNRRRSLCIAGNIHRIPNSG